MARSKANKSFPERRHYFRAVGNCMQIASRSLYTNKINNLMKITPDYHFTGSDRRINGLCNSCSGLPSAKPEMLDHFGPDCQNRNNSAAVNWFRKWTGFFIWPSAVILMKRKKNSFRWKVKIPKISLAESEHRAPASKLYQIERVIGDDCPWTEIRGRMCKISRSTRSDRCSWRHQCRKILPPPGVRSIGWWPSSGLIVLVDRNL